MREAEVHRLESAVAKQAEAMEAVARASGVEQEAVLAAQLSKASASVLELERKLEEASGVAEASKAEAVAVVGEAEELRKAGAVREAD